MTRVIPNIATNHGITRQFQLACSASELHESSPNPEISRGAMPHRPSSATKRQTCSIIEAITFSIFSDVFWGVSVLFVQNLTSCIRWTVENPTSSLRFLYDDHLSGLCKKIHTNTQLWRTKFPKRWREWLYSGFAWWNAGQIPARPGYSILFLSWASLATVQFSFKTLVCYHL